MSSKGALSGELGIGASTLVDVDYDVDDRIVVTALGRIDGAFGLRRVNLSLTDYIMDTDSITQTGDPSSHTQTGAPTQNGTRQKDRSVEVLFVAFHGSEPLRPACRYSLEGIDIIELGRGRSSATRECRDGFRYLVVQIPDSQVSTRHAKLVRSCNSWLIQDLGSKNGTAVGGMITTATRLAVGELFSIGNTILFVARQPRCESPDLASTGLAPPLPELATFDPKLGETFSRLVPITTTEMAILILGETGTGKEVVARAIHTLSGRPGPLVAVNCAAIPSTLLEAELFGHRRSAFSGALGDRLGHIRSSDRGTLFLDEIAELSPHAQAALLRVLQEREVVPIGDSLPTPVDLRVVAATNRDLVTLVGEGKFREDLYARIAASVVNLPPLRKRRADLGLLISALLRRRPETEHVKMTWQAATQLFAYAWPRNIRELASALEMAVALAGSAPISTRHLPPALQISNDVVPASSLELTPRLSPDEEALKQRLLELLRTHGGEVTKVARALGKDRKQIYRWMGYFGLRRDAC